MGDDTKVKVAVRVRPVNKRELELNTYCCVDMRNNETILENREERKGRKKFNYDHCFWSIDAKDERFASQEVVFDALGKGVLKSSFDGYNACIFAYGQTGSGKSYTMMGTSQDEKLKGIIPRLCDALFARIAENGDSRLTYKVEVSYMEIYCERVRDLLCGKETKHNLKVREHKTLGPYVEGLSTLAVRSFWDIESIMLEGNKSRTVAATQMNAESSRSHAVFSIVLTQTLFDPETNAGNEKVSRIGLVDLAGSERAGKTGALGDRLKEGSNINKSLHTLGLVISALAEISAGKKPRGSHVPYRDSTLTWLLKDSLGGNSKTVMVATVSPASDNYEETLSTLRYADRAKKIVNHAVINEDPNSKVIRELREEVEKLRQMLKEQGGGVAGGAGGAGGPSGTSANPMDSQDVVMLREKLSISENLMQEMSKTWEQKLVESEKLHQERQKVLEDMGISVKSAGIGVQKDKFYLVNLNADPIMSELLVCYLKPHTKIGRPDAEVQQDIQLKGLGIQPEHCVVEVIDHEVFITPLPAARTLVNGKIITEKTKICHGYRVLLGNNHFFRLSCPKKKVVKSTAAAVTRGGTKTTADGQEHSTGSVSSQEQDEVIIDPDEEIEIDETAMNYDFAMKEVILNELNSDPNSVYQQMKQSMEQQHFHEKQDALEQQKVHYERQLAELRDRLQDVDVMEPVTTSPPSGTLRRNRPIFSPMLEAEWEMENSQRVMDNYFRANTLVREANMLSQALEKDTVLKVTMQIPPSLLSPIGEGRYHQAGGNEIAVRVLQKARGTDSVWSMETLEEKVVAMRELFQMLEEGKSLMDDDATTMDPFFDIEQHVLLGVANIFTQCLFHGICHEYDAPIIGPTGKVCGSLKLALERVQAEDVDGDDDPDNGLTTGWEVAKDPDQELVVGSQIEVKIHVMEATGLPSAYCHFVFAQYKFWGQSEPTTLAPLQVFSPVFGRPDKLLDGELKFDHTQVFIVDVTEDFLDYLEYGTLSVEVYGHRRTGFTNEPSVTADEDGQHKSFPDRCCEVMKNLQLWVGILELNDQGSYVPVSIEERKDVKTGGVYVLRQGQSRRIQVKVGPVEGSGESPLQCSHITSIAIGSVYVRTRNEEPLDSYQDIDLDRLRGKWADALMRRRDYLDKELRKIMEKKGRTKVDNEKEQELIDQWTMLLLERSVLLQPKPGSGVPGAPTRWKMSSGMETRVITLYLDLNDDMLTPCDDEDPMAAIATASLLGEKDDSMINLVLVKNNETSPEAIASWDSSVHDAPGLNCPTASNDRVYAILKVSVMLNHPPGIELVLRKRICLRVIKKVGFGASIMKLFSSGPSHTDTGAMYEVVTGIPKLEGMFRPPKIPSYHPSFVEVEENENVVEKFKEGMMSVRNILALDRLKQEVCLKEKLAKSGQLLRPAHNPASVDEAVKSSSQSEETIATPPPQEDFPNQAMYIEQREHQEGLGADSQVIHSPEVGGRSSSSGTDDRPISVPLEVPDINVLASSPPLRLSETAAVVEGNKEIEEATNPSASGDDELADHMISLTEAINNEEQQRPTVKRQGSERKSRSTHLGNSRRRAKSTERSSFSDNSLPTKSSGKSRSEQLPRKSIDSSVVLLSTKPTARDKSPERRNTSANKTALSNNTASSDSDEDQTPSLPPQKRLDVESRSVGSSRSSNSSLSSQPAEDNRQATANSQPACSVGEKVMVETPNGFKFGNVKFVGPTEFAPGEWIGVSLERPNGKHDGTVKGVRYFKCKDKHGLFVRQDKIIRNPSITGLPQKTPSSPLRQKGSSSSPSAKRKISNAKT